MIPLSFSFLKSQQTVGELRKVTREAQSPLKFTRGDKFVARQEIKHPAMVSKGFSIPIRDSPSFVPLEPHHSLMPRTLNYSKLNNARRDLEWKKAEKELGLIQL
jgi:hypothetical protein